MSQLIYTSDNFAKLSPIYPYDTASDLKQCNFYSDEQLNFNFSQLLSGVADTKVNNFSNLFLSKKRKLSDFFSSTPLTVTPDTFSTYFSFNAIQGNTAQSFCWAVDEDPVRTIGADSLNTYIEPFTTLQNRNFFDLIFLTPLLCKVTHEISGKLRYLTLDYTYNLSFAPDTGYDRLGPDSPQTFYYFYDVVSDLMILYKKIRDYPYYITYNQFTRRIALRQPPLGPHYPFNLNGVMRLRDHNQPADAFKLDEQRVSYAKDFATALNTTLATVAENNYLINTEFQNITGDSFGVNILTLKNELTPDNNNAVPSQVFITNKYVDRDYSRIFSGTSEVLGDDNIALAYKGLTKAITLKAGTITYLHVPQNIFPYTQLNINDTNLHLCGAIASDHPVKADKIFKKRATYKNALPFGQSTDEANGEFLCAWLSGSGTSLPRWMDRYYNPQQTTLLEALTGVTANSYVTNFDTIVSTISSEDIIFDKPSDLFFEPGNYYAYHHIGDVDIVNYLKVLTPNIVQQNFINYYSNNTSVYANVQDVTEFTLNGAEYSTSVSLLPLTDSNRFTITFDLTNDDWQIPFANQIIGNFLDDGFGLFYTSYITPYLYFFSGNILKICNTLGVLIDTIVFEDTIASIIRHDNLKNYYVVLANGKILQLTAANTVIGAVAPFTSATVVDCFYNTTSAAVLLETATSIKKTGLYDFATNTFKEITNAFVLSASSLVPTPTSFYDWQYIVQQNLPLNDSGAIAIYNNSVYCFPGRIPGVHLEGSNLYLSTDPGWITKFDCTTNTMYPFFNAPSGGNIRDFNIDRSGNFWIVTDPKIYSYSSERQLLTITNYNSSGKLPTNIDFVREITASGEQYYTVVSVQDNIIPGNPTLKMYKINPEGTIFETTMFDSFFPNILYKQNVANGDYMRRAVDRVDSSLNAKIVVNNIINSRQQEYNLYLPTSGIGVGYHNFALRFDAFKGSFAFFCDGLKVDEALFSPGQYTFSKTLNRPLTIGATPFYTQTLSQYIKSKLFYVYNCKMKNFGIYDIALNDSDINIIANSSKTVPDILYNMPAGSRSFIDEIERYFKLDVPILKATKVLVRINAGNLPIELQQLLEARIRSRLASALPHYSSVQLEWVDNTHDAVITYVV
jgi:hypothetical protein